MFKKLFSILWNILPYHDKPQGTCINPFTRGPRAEGIKTFIMAVDLEHMYSNKAEEANYHIYDDFKYNN